MTGMTVRGSSSRMPTWSVSPIVSPWAKKLPKALSKSFNARLGKCRMLASLQLRIFQVLAALALTTRFTRRAGSERKV